MQIAHEIARTIRDGFDEHYRRFRRTSAAAKERFERADGAAAREAARARIAMYDERVRETVDRLEQRFPLARHEEMLWPHVKQAYIGELYEHLQPECAETFYNSVACRVLHRRYYRNEYIFWRPAVSTEHLVGREPAYRCYTGGVGGLRGALREAVLSFGLRNAWQNLERDLAHLERALREREGERRDLDADFQVQVLSSLFYRNRAAYLVGRIRTGFRDVPIVVPIVRDGDGRIALDALLSTSPDIARVLSLARTYFMVDMEVPSAFVSFLASLTPQTPKAELYTMLGLQKQGKTLFYRDLFQHLAHSSDRFVLAPGTKGMVMVVFTLPSFPFVFKVIRDVIAPPKDTDRREVEAKYRFVKHHDRAGRMADSLEYREVALPRDRFTPEVEAELRQFAPSMIEIDGDDLVIRHVYIERRMVPLDVFLAGADEDSMREAIAEYGAALRELASANVFAGDLLLKNFGVARHGRVVLYDYDEIAALTDVRFRRLPKPATLEDEMAGEPWFAIGPNDVFPEQFPTVLFASPRARAMFLQMHGDLADPRFWVAMQERIREGGEQDEVGAYPAELRFRHRYG